jgi:hypothetical protein
MNTSLPKVLPGLVAVALGAVVSAPLSAAEYWLQVQETTRTVATAATPPGTETITMWEYASCAANFAAPCVASAPGPVLRVPATDTQLIVHLQNNLTRGGQPIALNNVAAYGAAPNTVPTSIQIAGLPTPTFGAGNSCTALAAVTRVADADPAKPRVRSFTSEVANGASGTYCWSNLRAGSFAYQSGTHPALQVQMGLYGAVVIESPASGCTGPMCAYPGVDYDHEVLAIYSEIDPLLHAQVADGSYGDAALAKTSTLIYEPQYFFVDGTVDGASTGVAFTSLDTRVVGQTGDRILLRLVNAGLENHSPFLNGSYVSLVGEDGNAYDAPLRGHAQYSTLLAAGKTIDAIWTAGPNAVYPLVDRRRQTAHAAPAQGTPPTITAVASGMLVNLEIGTPAGTPVTLADAYTTPEDTTLVVAVADGVLANDPCTTDAVNPPCTTAVVVPGSGPTHGALQPPFNANGSFTYVPNANFNGTDSFSYTAGNGLANSAATTVTITVTPLNDAPVANNDGPYEVLANATTLIPHLVANDTDVDGDALVVTPVAGGATTQGGSWVASGADPGTAVYTAPAGFEGSDSFGYFANDGLLDSLLPATVTVNVSLNPPPTALDDTAAMAEDSGSVSVAVLANDSDPAGDPISVTSFTQSAAGTVVRDGVDPNVLVFTPNLNFNGVATFTYTITDVPQTTGAPKSATATVRVTVTPVNDAPVAVNNTFTVVDDATNSVAAPGVLGNDSDVDGDPLTAVIEVLPGDTAVTLNANGGFTVASGTAFVGTAIFHYRARDPSGALSNVATVTVSLTNTVFQVANGGVQFNSATNRYSANGTTTLPAGRTLTFTLFQPGASTGTVITTANVGGGASPRNWSFSVLRPALTAQVGSTVRVSATGLTTVTTPVAIQ